MKVAEKLGRRSTDEFKVGDLVVAQNMRTLKWTIRGQVVECRTADDGSTRSFIIKTDTGRTTLRNSRHLKFQAMKKNVRFADNDSRTDDGAVLNKRISDTATHEARVSDRAEKRVSARLAALRLATARLSMFITLLQKHKVLSLNGILQFPEESSLFEECANLNNNRQKMLTTRI